MNPILCETFTALIIFFIDYKTDGYKRISLNGSYCINEIINMLDTFAYCCKIHAYNTDDACFYSFKSSDGTLKIHDIVSDIHVLDHIYGREKKEN